LEEGDVVVTIEHCHGCQQHQMTTRHDSQAYLKHASAVREYVSHGLRSSPIRLAVVLKPAALGMRQRGSGSSRSHDKGEVGRKSEGSNIRASPSASLGGGGLDRVGAFEVQVVARGGDGPGAPPRSEAIHSKLATGRWPRLNPAFLRKLAAPLSSWGL
ncbi:unnamed protein product, partial [Discosporangium mesarthrocarpum]